VEEPLIDNVRKEDGVAVIELSGRFDAVSAEEAKQELHGLIEEGNTKLVLNLSRLEFIDSAGLGVLVSCLRRAAAEGGDLRVAEVPTFCRSIFELTRLTRVFDVTESEEDALKALEGQSG
jgi:anti-anti-sigma factor